MLSTNLTILSFTGAITAQISAWGQCGGIDYTGTTTCASGYSCVFVNDGYSHCQPGSGTASSSVSTLTSTSKPTSTGTPAAIRYLGRLSLNSKKSTGPTAFDLIIDGGGPTVISNVNETSISTPNGLAQGSHTVELRKRSEALFGSLFVGNVTTDGTSSVESIPARKIEFIGDSITVGYGLDGTYPCTNNAALEDNPKTYAALAANVLGADYSVVAWSGIGLTRNYVSTIVDTSPIMPERYTRYSANDADSSYTFPSDWIPDAVVINLGTNDFGYLAYNAAGQAYDARAPLNATTYTDAMVSFVQSIQRHYTDAQFFLMTSPMLSDSFPTTEDAQHTTMSNALQDAVSQIEANAHLVDWPTQGSDVGCDYHPNAATHAAEAIVLASAISTVIGW